MSVSTQERRDAGGGRDESPRRPVRWPRWSLPRPSRRSFSPEYKLRVLAEYEAAPNGEKGAVLRREGLYSSHVIEWARARDAGALEGVTDSRKRSTGSDRSGGRLTRSELERLRARNAKLKADLARTRTALDIMGKSHALLVQFCRGAEDRKYSEFPSVDGRLDARRCWSTAVGAAGQATRADSLGGSVPAVSGWRAQAARSSGLIAQGRNRSRAAPVGGVPPAWAQACR